MSIKTQIQPKLRAIHLSSFFDIVVPNPKNWVVGSVTGHAGNVFLWVKPTFII